ncbi:GNAT family N-acetyltransferase [Pseudoduganella namucuonensis]|uniref:Acetyltransferase (GNAT) family protein n=1 Tax=Pseudoduganella namucuonensis TaxID=1035707 RepID=A0A1I7IVM0_9BURK|nr:GNAT family N-acetyltransferase [Pseudoduganella namucuonensis]SFU76973.1 Acetyltransferase (GNAT) family protein [Pseudoduganella namucuonensis]
MTGGVRVEALAPDAPEALALLEELSAALSAITGDSGRSSFDPADVRGPMARFVVARDGGGAALGCGAFRPMATGEAGEGPAAEVKRMYARPGRRGVGGAILAFLEAEAAALGYRVLRLSTRLVNTRAVAFYEARGYARIANFGRYAAKPESVCFEKRLY